MNMNTIVYYKLNDNGIRHYNKIKEMPRTYFYEYESPYDASNKNGWIRDSLWSVFKMYGSECDWGKDCLITILQEEKPEDYK